MKGYTPYDKTVLKDYSLEKGSHSHPHAPPSEEPHVRGGLKKTGPDDGPHPDRKTNISAEVVSVQPDGGNMMVRVPGVGVRKVSGGAQGIAEIKEGSTVKVNIGAGDKVTLASAKDEDTKRTAGHRSKGRQPGPRA